MNYKFECLIEDTGEEVIWETLQLENEYAYRRSDRWYAQWYNSPIELQNFKTMDMIQVFKLSDLSSTKTERTVRFTDEYSITFTFVKDDGEKKEINWDINAPIAWYNKPTPIFVYPMENVNYQVTCVFITSPFTTLPNHSPSYVFPTVPDGYTDGVFIGGLKIVKNTISPGDSTYFTQSGQTVIQNRFCINYNFVKKTKITEPVFYMETTKKQGGKGNFTYITDGVDFPSLPDITVVGTGFVSMYKLSLEQINNLSAYLWSTVFLDNLPKLYSNPNEAIINLTLTRAPLTNTTPDSPLIVGNLNTNLTADRINNQYVICDFGFLDIAEYWGNYLDYESTEITIYLPYIGVRDLDIKDVMQCKLHLIYNIDLFSGECVALLKVKKEYGLDSVIYTFDGNVCIKIPFSASDMSSYYIGILSTVKGLATGGKSISGAISAVDVQSALGLQKEKIIKSGTLEGIKGLLNIQSPFLILTRPEQSLASKYETYKGYPSNITMALKSCRGFTQIAEIHLENISATSQELEELDSLLKSGVIF